MKTKSDLREGTPNKKPSMDEVPKEFSFTMQQVGSPVPVSASSAQAGHGTSLSDDCSASRVDHLATIASLATSEEKGLAPPLELCALERRVLDVRKAEDEHFRTMSEVLKEMKEATERQRNISMPVKNGLSKLIGVLDALCDCRATCRAAESRLRNAQLEPTPAASVAPQTGTARKRARQTAVFSPQEEEERRKKRAQATATPSDQATWTTVVGRKAKTKRLEKPAQSNAQPAASKPQGTETPQSASKKARGKNKGRKRRWPRARTCAVVIQPAPGKTYADVLSVVRQKVRPEEMETKVRQIRQTQSGGVLLELARGGDKQRLQSAIEGALGESGRVRELVPRASVEVLDLDACTTREEVQAAIA